jgi:chorismate mutase
MILIKEKNKYEFDDLFNSVIETEDKFLNKKLNSNICFGGKGGGGQQQQDIAPTLKPYVTDVLSRAKGAFGADQPYQAYPGERVVGFTPQELAAQQGIQQMAGQYGLASMSPELTASAAYYSPAYGYLGQTGQALGQQAGALAEAPRLFGTQEALYGEALRPISGIQQQLTGAGALLGEAGMRQRAAARDIGKEEVGRFGLTGEDIQQYMDPYQQAVIDIEKAQAQQDALQTAQAIAAKSVGAGAFGGSRQAILESQAASDLAKRLSDIQTRGSQAAYQQALQTAAQQQQVGLGQAAQQRAREQQLGAGLAGLAGARQQLGVGGYGSMAEQLRQAGAGFGGLGGQYGQLAGQYGQLGGGLGALSGQYGALGQQALGQGYRELGYLSGVGEAQRGLGQQRADISYGEFVEQRDFPTRQLERYAGLAFGVPGGYMQQQQAQPSGFQQAVGGLTAAAGLGRGLGFFKKGGDIGKGGLSTVYRQSAGTITDNSILDLANEEEVLKRLLELAKERKPFDKEAEEKRIKEDKGFAIAQLGANILAADPSRGALAAIGSAAPSSIQQLSALEKERAGLEDVARVKELEGLLTEATIIDKLREAEARKLEAGAADLPSDYQGLSDSEFDSFLKELTGLPKARLSKKYGTPQDKQLLLGQVTNLVLADARLGVLGRTVTSAQIDNEIKRRMFNELTIPAGPDDLDLDVDVDDVGKKITPDVAKDQAALLKNDISKMVL